MRLPDHYRNAILDEFDQVCKLMAGTADPGEKLYYFSATHGVLNRVMNLHFDPLLVFAHQVLQTCGQGFSARLTQAVGPVELFRAHADVLFANLAEAVRDLRAAVESDDDSQMRLVLQHVDLLGYATTGNGLYLYVTGKLKLSA